MSIYVRIFGYERKSQHAAHTYTHRHAHTDTIYTTTARRALVARSFCQERTHRHTHTANTQRYLVVNASSQRRRMNPEKHNKMRRSTRLNAAAERRRRLRQWRAAPTQLRAHVCRNSLLAWCDRTQTLSLSLSFSRLCSLFALSFCFFLLALKTNIQSNCCLS